MLPSRVNAAGGFIDLEPVSKLQAQGPAPA
jgi:hypothetical protein